MLQIEMDEIWVRNFLSFGNKWQGLKLQQGLNLIQGNISSQERSNAAGKTNLLEAFPVALFGKNTKETNQDNFINWKNRRNCELVITFWKNNTTKYTVHRGYKPNFLRIYENDTKIPEPSKKKDYQLQLENEILNLEFNAFINLIYCNTNNLDNRVLKLPTTQKRKFIDNLFNLEFFTNLNDKITRKLKNIQTNKQIHDNNIQSLENQIEDKNKKIQDFNKDLKNVKNSSDELKEKQKEYDNKKEAIEEFKESLTKIKDKHQELVKSKEQNENTISKIDTKILTLNQKKKLLSVDEIEELEKRKQERDNLYKDKEEITNALNEFSEIEHIENQIQLNKDEIHSLQEEEKRLTEQKATTNYKLKELEIPEDLKDKTICPTCRSSIDFNKIKETLEQERPQIENQLNEITSKLENIQSSKTNLETENKKLRDTLNEYTRLNNKLNSIQLDLAKYSNIDTQLQNYYKNIDRSNRINNAISKLESTKQQYKNVINEQNVKLQDLETKWNKIEGKITSFDKLENDLKYLKEKVKHEQDQYNNIQKYIDETKNEKNDLQNKISDIKYEKEKLNNFQDYLEYLKDVIKDENVKQFAISNKIPFLNKQTNHYLSEAGMGFYIVLDKWLDAEIKGSGMYGCSYNSLSGGESKALDFAVQLACLDTFKRTSSHFIDILVADEILDSSIDNQGIERMMNIVSSKQKEDQSKVFIISHRNEIGELDALFDNKFLVEKDTKDDFSKIYPI